MVATAKPKKITSGSGGASGGRGAMVTGVEPGRSIGVRPRPELPNHTGSGKSGTGGASSNSGTMVSGTDRIKPTP